MSLHNFNSNTKSWKMYTNTLTSVSGDDLLVMPSYGKDLILEVSANNEIFFKKGGVTKRFDNLVSDYLDKSFNSLNSQVQYILQEISGASVKDFITSGISNDLLIKSYAGRDIILEVSGNSEIIFKRGDFSYNLDDLIGGGSQSSDYATYNILDITGKIIFTDNSGTSGGGTSGGGSSGGSSNIVLTSISGNIFPSTDNTFKLGDVSKNWSNAYIRDISVSNIDISGNLNPLIANSSSLGSTLKSWSNAYIRDISVSNIEVIGVMKTYKYNEFNSYTKLGETITNLTGGTSDLLGSSVAINDEGNIIACCTQGASRILRIYKYNDISWVKISPDIGEACAVALNSAGNIVAISNRRFSFSSGIIKVYRYVIDNSWVQISQTITLGAADDALSLNSTGNILAIGSPYDNTTGFYSGATRVYKYITDGSWIQLGQTISGETAYSYGGYSVSLNSNGTILAIGASYNNNAGGNYSGQVRIYRFTNDVSWIQISQDIDGTSSDDNFGFSVSLNSDGTLVACGAMADPRTGYVKVYKYISDGNWTPYGQTINGEATNDEFGVSVSLNKQGNILGIGGPYNDGSGNSAGHVRVYKYNDVSWIQIATDIDGDMANDQFGTSIALNGLGNRFVVGAPYGSSGRGYVKVYTSTDVIQTLTSNILPLANNTYTLGSSSLSWSNAYIRDVSASNIDVSGKLNVVGATKLSNSLDVSGNVTFGGSNLYVPSSFTIDPMGHGDNTGTVLINGNLVVQGVTTTINSTVVDISDKMLVLASNASNSLQADGAGFEISGAKVNFLYNNSSASFRSSIGMSISGNVVPVTSTGSLGSSSLSWSNAYIRDVSTTNIEVSGNIVPLLDLSSSLGSSLKRWTRVFVDDLSVNKINGQAYSASGGGGSSTALTSDVSANSINTNTFNIQGSLNITNNEQLINRIGQIIPSEGTNDKAGWSVAINDIGDIIAIGATRAGAPGQVSQSGHVRVYKYNGSIWVQQGDDMDTNRGFAYAGWSVSLNSAGNIVAMGAPNAGDSESAVGMVRVYKYNNVSWIQEGLDIYGELNYDWSGGSGLTYSGYGPGTAVSLNSAGNIVAIGSTENIDGKGHVRVYQNNSGTWTPIGTDIDGEFNNDRSGFAVSLNSDGTVLAVGSPGQDSGSNPSGIVRVYKWNGSTWGKRGLNIGGETLGDKSGIAVSINSVGDIVAIGGPFNDGAGTDSGHVRVYKWNNVSWQQLGVLDIDGENASDKIGIAVSLNSAGDTLAIGVPYNTNTKLGSDTGCVRIYKYNGINWIKQGITIEGLMTGGNFGWATALNAAGNRVVIGAPEAAYGNGHSMVYEFSIGPPVILSNNILPLANNSYSLGTTANRWSNAYINNIEVNGNITVSNRIYQEFNYHSNWNAVNGHLGLAKDAYPALNPYSSGLKAFQTWTPKILPVDATWNSVAWSPLLQRFVAVGERQYIITSTDGITWNQITGNNINCENWRTVCWSPQLRLFVAFGANSDFRTMWSSNGIDWTQSSFNHGNFWNSICWSPELATFFAIGNRDNFIATSTNGINWTGSDITLGGGNWSSICWSAELKLLVAVSSNVGIIISTNGVTWTLVSSVTYCTSVCWSPQLGLFVAVGMDRVVTSSNGTSWRQKTLTEEGNPIYQIYQWLILNSICWCAELRLFVACSTSNAIISSFDGINWTLVTSVPAKSICWSPELGIFVAIGINNMSVTSSLKGRPPTSYNVFDSSFNSIDETGKWTFSNMAVKTLTVTLSFTNNSDDRVKHNEVIINNGLDVIDKLTPKFYQKTLDLLDVSYNGDLSGHTWIYEAGLIAQEVLQVPDLSFAVSGGDYYESVMHYDLSYNDLSYNDLSYNDLSYNDLTRPSRRGNYYEVSKNLIKQSYGLNYNNVFVYGLAAIKELHQKVKAQETSISTLQTSMLEQQATINSLLARLQALETGAN